MGPVHLERPVGLEEWPQRLRAQRLWPGSDRHPPQPAVWCPQVHSAIAPVGNAAAAGALTRDASGDALFPAACHEPKAKRLSFHSDFNAWKAANPDKPTSANPFCNPISKRGPMEGRPPGEVFAHQRWDEFFPKVGYVLSLGEIDAGYGLHPSMPYQQPNSIWTYGVGKNARGSVPPLLIKARYGEPLLVRVYNCLLRISRAARVQGPGLEPWLRSRRNPAAFP